MGASGQDSLMQVLQFLQEKLEEDIFKESISYEHAEDQGLGDLPGKIHKIKIRANDQNKIEVVDAIRQLVDNQLEPNTRIEITIQQGHEQEKNILIVHRKFPLSL